MKDNKVFNNAEQVDTNEAADADTTRAKLKTVIATPRVVEVEEVDQVS